MGWEWDCQVTNSLDLANLEGARVQSGWLITLVEMSAAALRSNWVPSGLVFIIFTRQIPQIKINMKPAGESIINYPSAGCCSASSLGSNEVKCRKQRPCGKSVALLSASTVPRLGSSVCVCVWTFNWGKGQRRIDFNASQSTKTNIVH